MDDNYTRSFNDGGKETVGSSSSSSSSVMSDCLPSSNGIGKAGIVKNQPVVVKQEPDLNSTTAGPDDVSDYAQNTMNELLAIYGYEGVDKSVTRQLHLMNFAQKQEDTDSNPIQSHSEHEDDSNSQDSARMLSGSPRLSSNGSAEQPEHPGSSDVNNPQTDSENQILCDWCKSYRPKRFTLRTSSQTKAFCSEQCFASCRRVYLKYNNKKICHWCKHSRHNTEYVPYRHGNHTVQFCSVKCLSQFKKNEGMNDFGTSDVDYRGNVETMRQRTVFESRVSGDASPPVRQPADGRTVLVNPTYKSQPLNLTSPLPGVNAQINLLPTTQLMPAGQVFSPFQTINSHIFQFPTLMQPQQMLLQQQSPVVVNQSSQNTNHRVDRTTSTEQVRNKYRQPVEEAPKESFRASQSTRALHSTHTSENTARTSRSSNDSTNRLTSETSTEQCSLLPPTTIMVPHPVFVPVPIPIPIPIPVPADKFPKSFQQTFNNQRPEDETLPTSTPTEQGHRHEHQHFERNEFGDRYSSTLAPPLHVREKRKLLPKPQHSPSYIPIHPQYVTMSSQLHPPESISPAEPVSIHRPQFVMLNRPPPNKLPIPRIPRKPQIKERDDVVIRINDKYPRQLSASTSQLNSIEKIGNAESSSKVREALRCHLTRRLSQSAVNLVEAAKIKPRGTPEELRRSLSLGRLNEDRDKKLRSKVSHSLGNIRDGTIRSEGATVTDEQIRQDAAHTAIRPENLKRPLESDVYRLMDLKLKRKRFLTDVDS